LDIRDQDLVQMLLDGLLVVVEEEETLETTKHGVEQVHQELLPHMLVLVMVQLLILLTLLLLKQYRWEDLDQDLVVEEVDGPIPQ
tara:strand:- start:143 stop:397 length:255 start_codon:yes stop_codon:yes gene_type:complete